MSETLTLKPDVALGVVPTHIKFVGGLLPDDQGKLPREEDGRPVVVAEMARICELSRQKPAKENRTATTSLDFVRGGSLNRS